MHGNRLKVAVPSQQFSFNKIIYIIYFVLNCVGGHERDMNKNMFHIAVILLLFLLFNGLSVVCKCINAEITIAVPNPAHKQSREEWLGRISSLKPRNIKNGLCSYAKRFLDKP